MTYKEIIYSVEGEVAVITLNRPDTMNALTLTTHAELAQAIDEANSDDKVRVIVLTGAGKGFCAGDDIRAIFLGKEGLSRLASREQQLKELQGEHHRGSGYMFLEISKPSIAAVNGAAVGYGCDLALLCNMRVASDKARFGEVFLRVGLIPGQALILLPRLVGLAKTYEMVLTTDIIDAKEAERIGLVNKVVPHEELMPATMEMANKIAGMPPISVRLAMESIRRGLDLPMERFLEHGAAAFAFCSTTEDHLEGARAFVEKRKPVFKGR